MSKKTSFQQRRRRTIILGVVIGVLIIGYVALTPPSGYAAHAPEGTFIPLPWKQLQAGKWEDKSKPVVVDAVKRLNGQQVKLKGFLLPLHVPAAAAQFFVAERPRGCYFCNPPGIAEVVEVNVRGGQVMPFTDLPVTIYGHLRVATGAPTDEMLYIIDDATLTAGFI